jgi:WD40 repeat protein/ABC-type taurine transport system ATPase subunit
MKPLSNPFVGLRPFQTCESHLFFGRRGQINDLLTKLQPQRLLAVVGRSGCGKSSLVRAGLIPALAAGFLVDDREQWRICVTQPGSSPLRNLATSLCCGEQAREISPEERTRRIDRLYGRLQAAGARAAVEFLTPKSHAADALPLADDENLLILVDQFEELFRFGLGATDDATRDEAARFVTILLSLAERRTLPIYVVITMRSDYLRDCDAFYGLPEAINRSLYLVPRLTREMRREIIEAPVSLFNAAIAPRLVERLLEDSDDECRFDGTEEEPDQLPVLQHALMRTWEHWQQSAQEATDSDTDAQSLRPIDAADYEAIGTLRRALSNEANATLLPEGSDLPKRVFQALTETDAKKRRIRRAALISEITAEVGLTDEQPVREIVNRFSSDGRTFLVAYADRECASAPGHARIDISHESLIRRWDRLSQWVEEEAASADTYRRIAGEAQRAASGPWPLLRDHALDEAEAWYERQRPNAAWGKRYCPAVDFQAVEQFLAHSRAERDRLAAERERQQRADEARQAEQARQQAEIAQARETKLAMTLQLANSQKRRVRALRLFSAVTLVLAVVAFIFYRSAISTRDQQQKDRVYFSVVSEARDQLQARPQFALLLAAQALQYRNSNLSDLGAENVLQQGFSLAGGRALAAHTREIRNVAITSKSDALITASADGTVRRWDLKAPMPELSSTILHKEEGGRQLVMAAVSPDDKWMAMATENGEVKLMTLTLPSRATMLPTDRNLATGGPSQGFQPQQTVSALAFGRNGRLLIAGLESGTAVLWNLEGPKPSEKVLETTWATSGRGSNARQVSRIETSADGRWLALASADGAVNLWDVSTDRARLVELRGLSGVTAMAISSDSRTLFTGTVDGHVNRWELGNDGTATLSKRVESACTVLTLAISPDGRQLATGGQRGTIRLHTEHLDYIRDLKQPGDGRIVVAEFSPDNRWLVTVSADGPVRLWNLRETSGSSALRGHDDYVRDIAFSPDGHWLVTGGSDATARLWNLQAPDPADPTIRYRGHETGIQAMTISPDLRWLVAAASSGLKVLEGDGSSGTGVRAPEACDDAAANEGSGRMFSAVKVSSNGRWLATLSRCSSFKTERTGWEWELHLYDNTAGAPTPVASYGSVSAMDFSADSNWLIAGQTNGSVKVVTLQSGRPTARILPASRDRSPITGVAAGGSNLHAAAISVDGTIRLWDMTVEPAREIVSETFGKDAIAGVVISADERWLAVATRDPQNAALVWDIQASDVKSSCTVLAHHSKALTAIVTSSDSRLLITASRDGTARLYDLSAGFHPAGRANGAGCAPVAPEFNATAVFDAHSGSIDALRVSPDNEHLVTIDSQGAGRVWNLRTQRQDSPPNVIVSTQRNPIRDAAFSRDGHTLMTATDTGTIRSVDLEATALKRRAREVIGRNLSPLEWCQAFSPLAYQTTFDDLPKWDPDKKDTCSSTQRSTFAGVASLKNTIKEWLSPATAVTQAAMVR